MSANNQSKQSDTLSLTGLPDEQLIALFKQGDARRRKHVLDIFYDRHAPAVLQMAHRLAASRDQALEIFSEVWIRVCQKLPDFEWQGVPLLHWLLRIAKYVHLELYRRHKKEGLLVEYLAETHGSGSRYFAETVQEVDRSTPPSPLSAEAQPVADIRLARVLNQLKPIERKIVILIYFKNKNSTQISEILEMTPAAVRQRHKRILAKLRLGLT